MRRRKKESEDRGADWMATYSDMVTLLLCFFVLLFSFSTIDAQKFQAIMNSFQGSLGVLDGGKTLEETPYINSNNMPSSSSLNDDEEDFLQIKKSIEEYSKANGFKGKMIVKQDERGLIIRMLDDIFFDSGKAEVKPKAKEILLYIGSILNNDDFKDKHIKIEGHTDNDRINTERFPSNWELSVIRATNVLKLLVNEENISPKRISASGYGPNRPVVSNNTPEDKAKNRRVDIVILKSELNKLEPN